MRRENVKDTRKNESLQENNYICSNKFEINFCLAKCKLENEVCSREVGKMIKDPSLEKVPRADGLIAELYLNFKKCT